LVAYPLNSQSISKSFQAFKHILVHPQASPLIPDQQQRISILPCIDCLRDVFTPFNSILSATFSRSEFLVVESPRQGPNLIVFSRVSNKKSLNSPKELPDVNCLITAFFFFTFSQFFHALAALGERKVSRKFRFSASVNCLLCSRVNVLKSIQCDQQLKRGEKRN
jgi:hypothetical protein